MTPNGPSWSPDGGAFWRKDGKLYWHDGDITEDGIIRELPLCAPTNCEDFSAWSDEKRAEVKAAHKARREAYIEEQRVEDERIRALCASAKSKLTKEEYEAVQTLDSGDRHEFTWDGLP